jgi:hypothetical protein
MIVINWTGCGRKRHRPNLRYYPNIHIEKDGQKLECNKTTDPETAAFTTSVFLFVCIGISNISNETSGHKNLKRPGSYETVR